MVSILQNILKVFVFIVGIVIAARYAAEHKTRRSILVVVYLLFAWEIVMSLGWIVIYYAKISNFESSYVIAILNTLNLLENCKTFPSDMLLIAVLIGIHTPG